MNGNLPHTVCSYLLQTTREVKSLLFQMTTSVAQLKRLVDGLGTAKDTVDYRHRMSEQQSKIQETAKRIKDQITALNTDKAELPEVQKTTAAKLLQDFATILQVLSRPLGSDACGDRMFCACVPRLQRAALGAAHKER